MILPNLYDLIIMGLLKENYQLKNLLKKVRWQMHEKKN